MSGIAGILEFQGASGACEEESIHRMLSAMHYRGPDGADVLVQSGCALGYLSLVSTPFHCNQPLAAGDLTIVADARLDGREQLAAQLGVRVQTPDVELILAAYRRWNDQCVRYLTGDFSFAIYSKVGIFCARDHLGVKPFYYSENDGTFVFASEARAVQSVARSGLNDQRIADFLVYPMEHVDTISTFYEGVYRLPPASILRVTSNGSSIERYWNPGCDHDTGQSDEQCIEAFTAQLETAVSDRLTGPAPAAISLSGGVDSTTLVGTALSLGGQVKTYSTVSGPDAVCPESRFIHEAVSGMNVDATLIGPEAMAEVIDEVFRQLCHLQEPFDYTMIQMMLLNIFASRAGHRSMIDGVEGDMLYSLSSSYPATLYREGKILEGIRAALSAASVTGHTSYPGALWNSIRQLGSPRFLKELKQLVSGNPHRKELLDSMISREFAASTGTLSRLGQMRMMNSPAQNSAELHLQAVLHPALPAALERYDRVAALSGIEPRHPLLDKRLVELSLSLPAHLKVQGGWSKYILRKASEGRVPGSISWRTDKSENTWQCDKVLDESKGECIRSIVHESTRSLQRYVNPDRLKVIDEEDLVPLFGLANWLKAEHDLYAG